MRPLRRLATAVPLVLLTAGCDGNTLGPEHDLAVSNATDAFLFQVFSLDGVTDSRSYEWQNTQPSATIDVVQSITSGAVRLTIRDAAGTLMYDNDIAQDSDTTTPLGTAGTWTIEVRLESASGSFSFQVLATT